MYFMFTYNGFIIVILKLVLKIIKFYFSISCGKYKGHNLYRPRLFQFRNNFLEMLEFSVQMRTAGLYYCLCFAMI